MGTAPVLGGIVSHPHKRQVERVVLISGDSDFVPVIKTARREGIHVTLDPMRSPIKPELREHIDSLHCYLPPSSCKESETKPKAEN